MSLHWAGAPRRLAHRKTVANAFNTLTNERIIFHLFNPHTNKQEVNVKRSDFPGKLAATRYQS